MTWVKVPSITDTKQTIVSRSQAGNPVTNRLDFYLVSTNSTATLGLEVLNDGADVYSDTHSTVPSNEWAWLTVTRDWVAKTVTLSINDSAKTAVSAEDLFILENDTTELTIGMKYDPTQNTFAATQYLTAFIYDLKIYNVAKESPESTTYVLPEL